MKRMNNDRTAKVVVGEREARLARDTLAVSAEVGAVGDLGVGASCKRQRKRLARRVHAPPISLRCLTISVGLLPTVNKCHNYDEIRTNTNLLALVVVRQAEAKRTLIAEAILAEVDAVVDVGVHALCRKCDATSLKAGERSCFWKKKQRSGERVAPQR